MMKKEIVLQLTKHQINIIIIIKNQNLKNVMKLVKHVIKEEILNIIIALHVKKIIILKNYAIMKIKKELIIVIIMNY